MSGLLHFLGKEMKELVRTWRLPVIGGVVLLFALTGPLLALATPALLKSMEASQPGVVIRLPDPTWVDAYAQWVKNLGQIVAFVAIIAAGGSVAGEVASGTAMLVLTKPVSRAAFVVAKVIGLIALVAGCVVAGAALTQAVTLAVFGEAPAVELWVPTLSWLALAALLISITVALSTVVSTLAAAGIGVGVFFAVSLAALWAPLQRYTPVGLTSAPAEYLAGKDPELLVPVATSLLGVVVITALGAWLFSRREL